MTAIGCDRLKPNSACGLAALLARPIAHRGLHDARRGIIENTATAAAAAIAAGYGIEADLQVSADGEAMVYHDETLGRLTGGSGALRDFSASALSRIAFKATGERMMTLGGLLDLVAGRAALFIELKSRFDGDLRLARRTAALLAHYRGPVGIMSFDPALIALLRHIAPRLVRGIVVQGHYRLPHRHFVGPRRKIAMAFFWHGLSSRPAFLAYRVENIAALVPRLARTMLGLPVLAWTVRSERDRVMAARFADQVIFEGFEP